VSGVRFVASELRADGALAPATWGYEPAAGGWRVVREDVPVLDLGAGYRLLETSHAGICATDLARVHLPFPLPQVTGHEVVAFADGRPALVEINASHRARGLPRAAWCAHCRAGLDIHCPDRLVLGIDRLVGGFAPRILAPAAAIVPVPDGLDAETAALGEPFAAAWHAVRTIDAADGWVVAVLGLGRLGLLLVAALDVWRQTTGRAIGLVGVARSSRRAALARRLGADRVVRPAGEPIADVVVDATGSPAGLEQALAMARRAVHLKSTSGVPAGGLTDPTALVVDELTLAPWEASVLPGVGTIAAMLAGDPGGRLAAALAERGACVVAGADAAALAEAVEREAPLGADVAVVDSLAAADRVVRPRPGVARALVRPRGRILLTAAAGDDGALGAAVAARRLRVETSRCGSIPASLPALVSASERAGGSLGRLLVTAVVPASRLAEGCALAASPGHVKVLVAHPGGALAVR
jgi:threonine dehydrogenase-like Zn-dependent dehydrogenase